MPHRSTPHTVFLANDAVFEQSLVFLESFRTFNPTAPLSMIPFADNIAKFRRIAPVYCFDILQADTAKWDELATALYPQPQQKYRNRLRKMAVFDVKSAVTVYLDTDIVVLRDLSFLSQKILDGSAEFICTQSNNDPWVYNDNYKKYAELANSTRFNDGFFAFNPDRLDGASAYDVLVRHIELYQRVRAADVYAQPATNFIVDMLGVKVVEISRLFPALSPEVWYRGPIGIENGNVVAQDGKEVLFVHWAGPLDLASDYPMKELFLTYRSAALARLATRGIIIRDGEPARTLMADAASGTRMPLRARLRAYSFSSFLTPRSAR